MNKYIVRFLATNGNVVTEWVEAKSDSEALTTLENSHINIKKILSVTEV